MLQVLTKISVCSTHMYHYYAYIYAIEHVYTWCDVDPLGRSSFRWPTASELDLVAADAVPVVESHRRRYGVGWNHIGDDTASAGSPQLPIPVPLLPFQPFPLPILPPFNPTPAGGCEANGATVRQTSRVLLASPAALLESSPGKAYEQAHVHVVGWRTGPVVHGATKHQVTHHVQSAETMPVPRAGRDTLR